MPEASPQHGRHDAPQAMLDDSQGQPQDTVPGSPECLKESPDDLKSTGNSQGTPPRKTQRGVSHSPESSAPSLPSSYASGSSVCCLKLLFFFWQGVRE